MLLFQYAQPICSFASILPVTRNHLIKNSLLIDIIVIIIIMVAGYFMEHIDRKDVDTDGNATPKKEIQTFRASANNNRMCLVCADVFCAEVCGIHAPYTVRFLFVAFPLFLLHAA